MIKEILEEELGISNEVNNIVLKIKQMISENYHSNKDNISYYFKLPFNEKIITNVFINALIFKYNNYELKIFFNILDVNNENIKLYKNKKSSFNYHEKKISLFLTSDDGKILWKKHSSTLQHEVEHFFQCYMKEGPSINNVNDRAKYKKYADLARKENEIQKSIGLIFYLAYPHEKDAYINGLYRKIMEINDDSYIQEPIEVLKNYQPYIEINNLRKFINKCMSDIDEHYKLLKELQNQYIKYDYFIQKFDSVIHEYIKGFGRVIYKANKDLIEKFDNIPLYN